MNQAYEGRVPTQKLTTMADVASMNTPRITWISNMLKIKHRLSLDRKSTRLNSSHVD